MNTREHFETLNRLSVPLQQAAHAIGLDYKAPYARHGKQFYKPYRNFFGVPDVGSKVWEELDKCGYANRDNDGIYHLTRKGLDWLGDSLKITIQGGAKP